MFCQDFGGDTYCSRAIGYIAKHYGHGADLAAIAYPDATQHLRIGAEFDIVADDRHRTVYVTVTDSDPLAQGAIGAHYRVGMDEYRFSQLKDAAHSMLVLGTHTEIGQLKEMILEKAADLKLPVSPEKVTLGREGVRTSVSVAYSTEPEVFPGYKYPRDHSFTDEIAAIR